MPRAIGHKRFGSFEPNGFAKVKPIDCLSGRSVLSEEVHTRRPTQIIRRRNGVSKRLTLESFTTTITHEVY